MLNSTFLSWKKRLDYLRRKVFISLHKVPHWAFTTGYSILWDTVLGSATVRKGLFVIWQPVRVGSWEVAHPQQALTLFGPEENLCSRWLLLWIKSATTKKFMHCVSKKGFAVLYTGCKPSLKSQNFSSKITSKPVCALPFFSFLAEHTLY